MITFTDYFQPQRENINSLLLTVSKEPNTTYYRHRRGEYELSEEELKEWYQTSFVFFPLYTTEKSDEVIIPNTFQRLHRKYHKQEAITDSYKDGRNELEDDDRASLLLDLEEYIIEWIESKFHDFAIAINHLKNGPVFAGIHDDLVVMKNLLNHYLAIRKSADIQLVFFHHISIPKAVADEMTDVLIILLTDRIKMCEPGFDPASAPTAQPKNQSHFRINWLASQLEFAELIHQLTEKGYISLPDASLAFQARKLTDIFDFTASQRKKDADIASNILTALKPVFDNDQQQSSYSYLLKPGYKQKFNQIPVAAIKSKKGED